MQSQAENVVDFDRRSSSNFIEASKNKLNWSKNEIHLPRFIYGVINLYQVAVSVIVPMMVIFIFFRIADSFILVYYVKIILFGAVVILSYLLYIFISVKLSKSVVLWCKKKMPLTEGVFRRSFNEKNVEDKRLYYYHVRGFTYKWPVFTAKKTFFPWMVNYALREIGGNRIGRDSIYADTFVGLEFTDLASNSAILYSSSISSHVVDSIFGNLTIKSITVEDNGILQPHAIAGPGSVIGKNTTLFPFKVAVKNEKCLEKYYFPFGIKYQWRGIDQE